MTDTSSDNVCNFTTRYTYGNSEQEYVFSCRGRPFAALVSSNLSTPTSSLFDYDLIKSLGLKLTDLQCKKFFFAGNKFRILGRISTTVQCIQNGRSGSNFHVKGLVIADLNKALDTHCVAGHKMQQQISSLCVNAEDVSDDDVDDLNHDRDHHHDGRGKIFNERKCKTQTQVKSNSVKRKSESKAPTHAKKPDFRKTDESSSDNESGTIHHVQCDWIVESDDTDYESVSNPAETSQSWMLTISSPHSELPPHLMKTGHGYGGPCQVSTELPPGTCPRPSTLYGLKHFSNGDYDFWSEQSLNQTEVKALKKSQVDGKPRVVNVNADKHRDDMLRVGIWTKLDDPSEHQRRHVLIASLRRSAPDRVCQVCSYMLQHSCSKHTGTKHCTTCCDEVKSKVKKSSR